MNRTDIPQWAIERGRAMRNPRTLPPSRTAVLVIDMQNFFIAPGFAMGNPHALDIVPNINRLTTACRAAGATIVFLQHSFAPEAASASAAEAGPSTAETRAALRSHLLPGSEGFALHPDIAVAEGDLCLTKHTASPLHPRSGCDLLGELRSRGIEQVVVTGVVTNGCCETTARDAHQHGFQVLFVTDANAAMTDEEHNAALLNLAILFAQVPTTAEVVAAQSSD